MHSQTTEHITHQQEPATETTHHNAKEMCRSLELGDDWQKRFYDYLDDKPGGRDAWGNLVLGSNMALLILLAANITSDLPCALKDRRKRLRTFSKDLKAGIPQILATAETITELNCKVSEYGVEPPFAELPSQLRTYARDMAGFAKVAAQLSTDRLPQSADFELFFLHAYLISATGKPQWCALATLLEAAHAGHRRSVEVDEECLRRKVERMTARDASECSHLEQVAHDYVATLSKR